MQRSIATVSLSGTLPEKLEAIAAAGFDGVEIFENDLLHYDGSPRDVRRLCADLGLEILLFQATRELLLNVTKHAHGTRAEIELTVHPDRLELSVSDNGVGMNTSGLADSPSPSGGFGLFNIRERLRLVDGTLDVTSDERTRISLRVPLAPPGT